MKITGGSFGIGGDAYCRGSNLVIYGAVKATIPIAELTAVNTNLKEEKKFGAGGFIVGGAMLAALLGYLFGPFGILAGIILAALGSFYTSSKNLAQIDMSGGERLDVECSRREISKLVKSFRRTKYQAES